MIKSFLIGALALALLLNSAAQVGAEYIVSDLGTLGGSSGLPFGPSPGSYALGINDAGQVVGYSDTANYGTQHAFLYSGGKMTDLGTLGQGNSWAYAINNTGQVVGFSNTNQGISAFLYSGGTITNLGSLFGSFSSAYAINNVGQVVGITAVAGTPPHAFLYTAGKMVDLGSTGNSDSRALGINTAGQVVGMMNNRPFLLSGGQVSVLGSSNGGASAINASGQVVGWMSTPTGDTHAFLYSAGKLTDLGALAHSSYSLAQAINDAGQVVGSNGPHAFLFSNGKMMDLNSLISPESHWTLFNANGINNKGQIVGYGSNPSGTTHAFLLSPVPEPSSLVLLGLGAVGLAGRVWRKRRRAVATVTLASR